MCVEHIFNRGITAQTAEQKWTENPMTTHDFLRMKKLWEKGYTAGMIAEEIGISKGVASKWLRYIGINTDDRSRRRKKAEYTVYNRKDEVVAFGDAETCARTLGIKRDSFFCAYARMGKRSSPWKIIREN